jgi:hypothetical protein
MEWTITQHTDDGYAEIVTQGIADKESSLAMAKACSDELRKSNITKILIDHSNISKVSGGIVDVYNRPKEMKKIGVSFDIKIAEIVRPEHKEFFKFLETVAVNRGFQFSIFLDREAALHWLLQP